MDEALRLTSGMADPRHESLGEQPGRGAASFLTERMRAALYAVREGLAEPG